MVNFRFHIASLIAVFLALALGVVMGSTVIDRAIVDSLNSQVDRVEKKADNQRKENKKLTNQINNADDFANLTAEQTVRGSLADIPTVVIASRGTSDNTVNRVVELARASGAKAPGIIWLEKPWALKKKNDINRLAELLGVSKKSPDTLRATAAASLVDRLTSNESPNDILASLVDAKFISLDSAGSGTVDSSAFGAAGTKALMLNSPQLGGLEFSQAVSAAFLATGNAPTLGEVFDENNDTAERGDTFQPLLSDDAAKKAIATTDNLDRAYGPTTIILALRDLNKSVVGHYGEGKDAQALAPG